MTKTSFDIQDLIVSSDRWTVILKYESWRLQTKTIETTRTDSLINLSKNREWDSTLKIEISEQHNNRTCIVTGIEDGTYLHTKEKDDEGQSVKIDKGNLILSLGFNFVSIDLRTLKLNWKIQPDMAEIFEFYEFEGDYLLRGEVGIHRIDKMGKVKWTFSAADIWVNMEGLPEVEITDRSIKLLDFNSDEYEIDFNGKEIKK